MKNKSRLKAIFIAMLSFVLIAQQSIAQRAGRDRAAFRGNTVIVKPVTPSINNRNISRYGNSRRPMITNRFNYQPRFMPYGKRSRLPFAYTRIAYMGRPFYYTNGLYYANYGNYYGIVSPPFGLTLGLLPRGYWGFNFGGFPYYYYSGVFYRSTNDQQYQVVEAPIGAEVPNLPNDAKSIIVNDQKLYEYLGIYYKEVIDLNGNRRYIVQGKDGVLNTDNMNEVSVENNNSATTANNYKPSMGDIVLQLPTQTKVVVINGKKLFVTPENIYYEEYMDDNILKYKVVGM
ncbi:MAG: hypothetical protein RI940_1165 [Bacteroidota bacterium]|jgi:hypothetical protein